MFQDAVIAIDCNSLHCILQCVFVVLYTVKHFEALGTLAGSFMEDSLKTLWYNLKHGSQ